jgi:hypothetical protein
MSVELLPCPFCGGGETSIRENRHSPTMSGCGGLISVEITHWCPAVPGQPSRNTITRTGRDHASAIAAWNRRTPPNDWQPIETAPTDGTAVLCWPFNYSSLFEGKAEPETVIGFFSGDDWWCESNVAKTFEPTHWRPLPSSPQ